MQLTPRKLKQERLQMIIREFAFAFGRATGVEPTREQVKRATVDLCQQFGGESYYLPKQPKAQHQAAVERQLAEGRKTQRALARSIGMSERTVRRSINGK